MDNRVDRLQIGMVKVANVFPERLMRCARATERAVLKEKSIHSHDHMTRGLENWHKHAADITIMASYHYTHEFQPLEQPHFQTKRTLRPLHTTHGFGEPVFLQEVT